MLLRVFALCQKHHGWLVRDPSVLKLPQNTPGWHRTRSHLQDSLLCGWFAGRRLRASVGIQIILSCFDSYNQEAERRPWVTRRRTNPRRVIAFNARPIAAERRRYEDVDVKGRQGCATPVFSILLLLLLLLQDNNKVRERQVPPAVVPLHLSSKTRRQ